MGQSFLFYHNNRQHSNTEKNIYKYNCYHKLLASHHPTDCISFGHRFDCIFTEYVLGGLPQAPWPITANAAQQYVQTAGNNERHRYWLMCMGDLCLHVLMPAACGWLAYVFLHNVEEKMGKQ